MALFTNCTLSNNAMSIGANDTQAKIPTMESTVDSTEVDLVAINIRGRVFQVERQSLMKQDGSRLQQIAKVHTGSQRGTEPLYFNRNSHLFESIADYCMSGKLHFSSCVCVNAFHDEMQFWGVHENALDACCYSRYKHHEELEAKKQRMQTYWDFARNMRCESSRLMEQCDKCWRVHLYLLLEEPKSSMAAWVWSNFVHIMTILSVSVIVMESVPSFRRPPSIQFKDFASADNSSQIFYNLTTTVPCTELIAIEYISTIFLTIELALRFAVNKKKKIFFKNPLNLCDLMSQIPPYAIAILSLTALYFGYSESMSTALIILSFARIIRMFRIFHIGKHFKTVQIIASALRESYRELLLLLAMLITASIFFATMLYIVEVNYDNLSTIPLAIWWALVTMTTIGYGDYHPVSGGGYFIASICAISGILIIALPTPIIVSNFNKLYDLFQTCERLAERKKPEAIRTLQLASQEPSMNINEVTKNKYGQPSLMDVDDCNIKNHSSTSDQINPVDSSKNESNDDIINVKAQDDGNGNDLGYMRNGTMAPMHKDMDRINDSKNNHRSRLRDKGAMTETCDQTLDIPTVYI